jgi:hypothetical protein
MSRKRPQLLALDAGAPAPASERRLLDERTTPAAEALDAVAMPALELALASPPGAVATASAAEPAPTSASSDGYPAGSDRDLGVPCDRREEERGGGKAGKEASVHDGTPERDTLDLEMAEPMPRFRFRRITDALRCSVLERRSEQM